MCSLPTKSGLLLGREALNGCHRFPARLPNMQPRVRYEHNMYLGALWWEMRTQALWWVRGGDPHKGSFNTGDRGRPCCNLSSCISLIKGEAVTRGAPPPPLTCVSLHKHMSCGGTVENSILPFALLSDCKRPVWED